MFGMMNVTPITNLHNASSQVSESLEQAVARLLDVTEHPAITKWVQFLPISSNWSESAGSST